MTDVRREVPPLMGCGHAANGTSNNGPACLSCVGIHPEAELVIPYPDLTGRFARCSCGNIQPSDPKWLAFFQSAEVAARQSCAVCHYSAIAHTDEVRARRHVRNSKLLPAHDFVPSEPEAMDKFYCGCRGWD